jgi:Mor family transcriptional regulator
MRGAGNPNAKLSAETVRAIRAEYAKGSTNYRTLAKKHAVTKSTIRSAIVGRSYRDVAGPTASAQSPVKLTVEQVRDLRAEYANSGTTQATLAAKYSISESGVRAIVNRKTWKDVLDDAPRAEGISA